MIIKFEHTDTFGGESNYCWVRHHFIEVNDKAPLTDLQLVRRAKKFAGFTGIKARTEKYGDMMAIWPRGLCQVCFITLDY